MCKILNFTQIFKSKRGSENWVVSANGRAVLFVLGLAVTNIGKVIIGSEHTSSKPNCVTLYHILIDTDLNGSCLDSDHFLISCYSVVGALLNE